MKKSVAIPRFIGICGVAGTCIIYYIMDHLNNYTVGMQLYIIMWNPTKYDSLHD